MKIKHHDGLGAFIQRKQMNKLSYITETGEYQTLSKGERRRECNSVNAEGEIKRHTIHYGRLYNQKQGEIPKLYRPYNGAYKTS